MALRSADSPGRLIFDANASLFLIRFYHARKEGGGEADLPRPAKGQSSSSSSRAWRTVPDSASIANPSARPSLVAFVWKMLPCDVIWMLENPSAVSLSQICCSVIGPIPGINLPDKLLAA